VIDTWPVLSQAVRDAIVKLASASARKGGRR
jgi:hypothetical protein